MSRLASTLVLGLGLLGACSLVAGEASTLTIVNRTVVPVAAQDRGSVSIVEACSERTLEYHGTWGGDAQTGDPVAESVPPDAVAVSLENQFWQPFEQPLDLDILVDSTHPAGTSLASRPELRSQPCEGTPLPQASP